MEWFNADIAYDLSMEAAAAVVVAIMGVSWGYSRRGARARSRMAERILAVLQAVRSINERSLGDDPDAERDRHYAEFLAALAESHGLVTLDRLTEAFDRIDTDGKGYITHDDLKTILGKDYDKETVDQMIEEGDFKKNGKIDYEELLQLMFTDPVKGDKLAGSITPQVSFAG